MVEVAANKSDGASLGDSSSTPAPRASPSPAASADIGGSQTTVDAPEIGGDTKLIPPAHKVLRNNGKLQKEGMFAFLWVCFLAQQVGAHFWLNKLALGWYKLDSPFLVPSQVLACSAGRNLVMLLLRFSM
jgi:hypothetical protein